MKMSFLFDISCYSSDKIEGINQREPTSNPVWAFDEIHMLLDKHFNINKCKREHNRHAVQTIKHISLKLLSKLSSTSFSQEEPLRNCFLHYTKRWSSRNFDEIHMLWGEHFDNNSQIKNGQLFVEALTSGCQKWKN